MSDNRPQLLHPLPSDDATLIPSSVLTSYIGVASGTLARWRYEGNGPEYVKIGRTVAYQAGRVRHWLESQRHPGNSE